MLTVSRICTRIGSTPERRTNLKQNNKQIMINLSHFLQCSDSEVPGMNPFSEPRLRNKITFLSIGPHETYTKIDTTMW